jgi:hypothetical protein
VSPEASPIWADSCVRFGKGLRVVRVGAEDGVAVLAVVVVAVVVDVIAVAAGTVVLGIVDKSLTSDVLEPGIKGTPPREVVIEISISRLRVWMAVISG